MKKYLILILQFFCSLLLSQSGDTLYLLSCYEEVKINYPLYAQKEILDKSSRLQIQNISVSLYPLVNLNAQATYQSEVTAIDINFPGLETDIPSAPYDQYKATIDLQQVIYDGGMTKNQKTLEKAELEVGLQQVEVSLYGLKVQVNTIYFSTLLLQKSIELTKSMLDELKMREKNMQSGVNNGILLQADLDELKAEILMAEKQVDELEARFVSRLNMLAKLLNRPVDKSVILALPNFQEPSFEPPKRPENVLFGLQIQQTEALKKMATSKQLPKLYAFGQAGYGRPGLNMLSDEFDPYYIVGVGLKWNIWDWGITKREGNAMELNKNLIKTQESAFNLQLEIALENEMAMIDYLMHAQEKDLQVIQLRNNVRKVAASQLENGTITTTDYLHKLNAELAAQIEYAKHIIELEQTKANYLLLKGEL